jgi:hypothetical protein
VGAWEISMKRPPRRRPVETRCFAPSLSVFATPSKVLGRSNGETLRRLKDALASNDLLYRLTGEDGLSCCSIIQRSAAYLESRNLR